MFDRYVRMNRLSLPAVLAISLLAACSSEKEADETPSLEASAEPAASPGRIFTYTSIEDCPVLRSNPDEAGFYEWECPGEGGYKLRVTESDLRQTAAVVPPGGALHWLDLSSVTGGGFSQLGKTVEWRGTLKDGAFAPDALIMRHEVVTDPEGKNTVSYLVAVKLAPMPCAIARIAPGPEQNAGARAAADAGGECLAGPG